MYHLTTRAKGAIFTDDEDRGFFLGQLRRVIRRHAWVCHAYCLMTTHYHVLVMTPEPDLARGMHRLNGSYAQYFNERHAAWGHVFAGRYGSVLVEGEGHLLELFRYIALNPVRAGACRAPSSWHWSSYAAAIGVGRQEPFLSLDFVHGLFGDDLEKARGRLKIFVEG
jgi:putative transposase